MGPIGLTGVDLDVTHDFSKDPFNIDVTQRDILAYPLAIRTYHVIYGQLLTLEGDVIQGFFLTSLSSLRACIQFYDLAE